MADIRVVAQQMPVLPGDPWHWVILSSAHDAGIPRMMHVHGEVRTVCGILIRPPGIPIMVTLHDTGAPDFPTCQPCIDGGLAPGLRAQISDVLDAALRQPVTASVGGGHGACSHPWHYADPATHRGECPRCGPAHGGDAWLTY